MQKGLIHVYYGDGKGKTTAAIGLGIRACGNDMKVHLVQFLKANDSCELVTLRKIGNFSLGDAPCSLPFWFNMNERQKSDYRRYAAQLFEAAVKKPPLLTCLFSTRFSTRSIWRCCRKKPAGFSRQQAGEAGGRPHGALRCAVDRGQGGLYFLHQSGEASLRARSARAQRHRVLTALEGEKETRFKNRVFDGLFVFGKRKIFSSNVRAFVPTCLTRVLCSQVRGKSRD